MFCFNTMNHLIIYYNVLQKYLVIKNFVYRSYYQELKRIPEEPDTSGGSTGDAGSRVWSHHQYPETPLYEPNENGMTRVEFVALQVDFSRSVDFLNQVDLGMLTLETRPGARSVFGKQFCSYCPKDYITFIRNFINRESLSAIRGILFLGENFERSPREGE